MLLREEHLHKKDISSLASCLDRIYTFLVLVLTWKRGYKIIFCTLKKLDALSIQRKAQPQKEDKEEKNKRNPRDEYDLNYHVLKPCSYKMNIYARVIISIASCFIIEYIYGSNFSVSFK